MFDGIIKNKFKLKKQTITKHLRNRIYYGIVHRIVDGLVYRIDYALVY